MIKSCAVFIVGLSINRLNNIQKDNFHFFLFLHVFIGIILCLMVISKKINIVQFEWFTIKYVFLFLMATIIYNFVIICNGLRLL
ncbi:hypothetical protein FOL75_26610 [Bacillus thuringiensis]|uniref:hypothetical protein n=1 Tax=Bacillus thuringiensis TaxID=1428 RepID=UPI002853EB7D|nr:hypothetical protein [Bacillus thuringiensis]MDR5025365.1 hypothetical protein [Bacillus thuringiensis]